MLDVSGAVEIEVEELRKIEQGSLRPSEDILMLLISHFEMGEDEATSLWEMAGYTKEAESSTNAQQIFDSLPKQVMVVMPIDSRIVYSDSVQVNSNEHGVIMNFSQGGGPNGQMAIARIGMSLEHAKRVKALLDDTIAYADKARSTHTKSEQTHPKSRKTED